MQPYEKIREYCESVCQQVRWKRARGGIYEEMENHIVDQRDAFIKEGLDEENATERALRETGNPVDIGAQLDQVHRPQPQYAMLFFTGLLVVIGILVQIYLTGSGNVVDHLRMPLLSQLLSRGLGILLMFLIYYSDYTLIGRHPALLSFIIVAVALAATFTSPIINGVYYYGSILSLLFPVVFAMMVYALRSLGYLGIVLSGVTYFVLSFVIFLVPSFSGWVLMTICGLVILGMAIGKGWFGVKKAVGFCIVYIPSFLMMLFGIITLAINAGSYRAERLRVIFHPELDSTGMGYVGYQVKETLAGAAFIGPGATVDKVDGSFIPELHTDYIVTYLIARLGWVVLGLILLALIAFFVAGLRQCMRQKGILGQLLSVAVLFTIFFQCVAYISANLGFILFGGITLPLISYGGTHAVINLGLIGLMLSTFRSDRAILENASRSGEAHKIFRWNKGELVISFAKK